jgi:hypothetical protein
LVATKQTDRKASTVSEPTACGAACCYPGASYCSRCDLLVGLDGLHVIAVERDEGGGGLTVTVESAAGPMGCPLCGVIVHSHGRRAVVLVDTPCFGRPVRLVWRKRTERCRKGMAAGLTFSPRPSKASTTTR